MTSRSLKATTAAAAVLSLLQPLPALTQSGSGNGAKANASATGQLKRLENADARSFEEICAEAMILDPAACELHIQTLLADAEAEVAADSAAQAATAAEAAQQEATEADAAVKAEAEAKAAELARAAADAKAQAEEAAATAARRAQEAAAEAEAEADAEAQARADAEAEAEASAEAEAEAGAQAQADAEAEAEAEALELERVEAAEEAEADAATQADADARAEAEAQAEAEAEANAQADAEAAAQTEADAQAEADATARAEAEAEAAAAAAERDEDTDTETIAETPAPPASIAEDCPAEVIGSDGTLVCVDVLTSEGIAALAAEAGDETEAKAEVTTETVTERDRRSSDEEFSTRTQDVDERDVGTPEASGAPVGAQRDTGLSDLEKAGLLALGAVVIGAILTSGQRVENNTGDRVIVVDDEGNYRVLKDDDALLRQPGSEVRTERFTDGSTRTTVTRNDGTRIITIRDSTGRALRRLRIEPDGREYLLIDEARTFEPVVVRDLPRPVREDFDYRVASDRENLRLALLAAERRDIGRSFSLRQVREFVEVRELAPEINLAGITFATNSAAIQPSQAEQLREMGLLMRDFIRDDPTELFLVEGHTDAIGPAGLNLLLSDRRAESVALALAEYFGVPPENMVVQGYGESQLKIPTQEAERLNRRVAVRRITPLMRPY